MMEVDCNRCDTESTKQTLEFARATRAGWGGVFTRNEYTPRVHPRVGPATV